MISAARESMQVLEDCVHSTSFHRPGLSPSAKGPVGAGRAGVLNVAIAVIGAMLAFEWDVLFAPETAAWIVGALGTLKLVINTFRDGITGLVKSQPPVQ